MMSRLLGGGGVKDFVTTGVKNNPNLRDVIYGRPFIQNKHIHHGKFEFMRNRAIYLKTIEFGFRLVIYVEYYFVSNQIIYLLDYK
jgi:hypothetical protein